MRTSTDIRSRPKRTSYLPDGLWNRVFYLVPVVVVLLYGMCWIAVHIHQARGFAHPAFQSLALAECGLALTLRRRKPVGALAGILAVYLVFDLEPITLLPVLISLFNLAAVGTSWITAGWAVVVTTLVVMTRPFIHGDPVDLLQYSALHLAAIGVAATAGLYWRSRPTTSLHNGGAESKQGSAPRKRLQELLQ